MNRTVSAAIAEAILVDEIDGIGREWKVGAGGMEPGGGCVRTTGSGSIWVAANC